MWTNVCPPPLSTACFICVEIEKQRWLLSSNWGWSTLNPKGMVSPTCIFAEERMPMYILYIYIYTNLCILYTLLDESPIQICRHAGGPRRESSCHPLSPPYFVASGKARITQDNPVVLVPYNPIIGTLHPPI